MQSEVVFSHSVKLITKLVDLQQNMQEIRSGLSNFQLYISRIISKVLESEDDVEVHIFIMSPVYNSQLVMSLG